MSFLHVDQAIIGLGGGIETRRTRRFQVLHGSEQQEL
jgi:hypothetical protein